MITNTAKTFRYCFSLLNFYRHLGWVIFFFVSTYFIYRDFYTSVNWHSNTLRFSRHFLPRSSYLCNKVLSVECTYRYDLQEKMIYFKSLYVLMTPKWSSWTIADTFHRATISSFTSPVRKTKQVLLSDALYYLN